MTPKITRNETEDRLLHVSEENVILKKHLRKQEDRIKQLATKLVRVIGERSNRGKGEDFVLEDQKFRIAELEGQVHSLRDKLLVTRQQLGSYTKLVPGLKQMKPKYGDSGLGLVT
jgi:protein fantom